MDERIAAAGKEQNALLSLLADALVCREEMPLGASGRVREHAARFGTALGLPPEQQESLERGALLRDVGKILIPNAVLLKAGVLTYDEWALLRSHCKLGAELLRERQVLTDIIDIVHFHHECFDGDGYPDHLEGEEIPYLARIVKILDVYCAMTSARHYRASQSSNQEAVLHLLAERGKHFDPALVDAFMDAGIADTQQG